MLAELAAETFRFWLLLAFFFGLYGLGCYWAGYQQGFRKGFEEWDD
jgi:hypothetical protein